MNVLSMYYTHAFLKIIFFKKKKVVHLTTCSKTVKAIFFVVLEMKNTKARFPWKRSDMGRSPGLLQNVADPDDERSKICVH